MGTPNRERQLEWRRGEKIPEVPGGVPRALSRLSVECLRCGKRVREAETKKKTGELRGSNPCSRGWVDVGLIA